MCKVAGTTPSPKSSSQHTLSWACCMLMLGNMLLPIFLKVNVMVPKVFCKKKIIFTVAVGIYFL